MKRKDIVDAWARIRQIDQTIPDEVLDLMKDAAIERLNSFEQNRYVFVVNDRGDPSVGINASSHRVVIETDYKFDNPEDTAMFKQTISEIFDTRLKAVQTEAEFIKEQKMVAEWEKDMDRSEEEFRNQIDKDDNMFPNPPFDQ